MSDSECSSTMTDLFDLLEVEENVLTYKTNSQQTRKKTVVMTSDEARCTEEVSVNNWQVFQELAAFQSCFRASASWLQGKVRPSALNLDLT